MRFIILIGILIGLSSCTQESMTEKTAETSPSDSQNTQKFVPKYPCSSECAEFDKSICEDLFKAYDACEKTKDQTNCESFVSAFSRALPEVVECTSYKAAFIKGFRKHFRWCFGGRHPT